MGTPTRADGALPSVSVVVPTYQRRAVLDGVVTDLLERCAPAELVVVDDGSTDGTRELVEGLMTDRPAWTYHWQANAGRSRARNVGIGLARGEIVVFIDSDVVVVPTFLETHLRLHREADPTIVSINDCHHLYDPVVGTPAAPARPA